MYSIMLKKDGYSFNKMLEDRLPIGYDSPWKQTPFTPHLRKSSPAYSSAQLRVKEFLEMA